MSAAKRIPSLYLMPTTDVPVTYGNLLRTIQVKIANISSTVRNYKGKLHKYNLIARVSMYP